MPAAKGCQIAQTGVVCFRPMAQRKGRRRATHYWKHEDNDVELGREHLDDLSEFLNGSEITSREVREIELATTARVSARRLSPY